MKKLNKKEWGILGTSIGSILIIVALLTMVGVGSNDTYAASVVQCTCPEEYDKIGNRCVNEEEYKCCTGAECESYFNVATCPSTSNCTIEVSQLMGVKYSCKRAPIYCTCPSGTELDSAGDCVQQLCPVGKYGSAGNCQECPAGSYCKDGVKYDCPAEKYCKNGLVYDCPANATCKEGSFTCKTGYDKVGDECVEVKQDIPCGSIGSVCRYNGKEGTCIDSGSNIGGIVCTAGGPSSGGTGSCPEGRHLSGGECADCPANATCPGGTRTFSCNTGYRQVGSTCVPNGSGGNPSTPSSGNPSSGGNSSSGGNPNTPSGGDSGTGGNVNSGNGGNGNTNQNPNTATKTPLVIAIIGTMSMALGTFAYFKGKKEINTEI